MGKISFRFAVSPEGIKGYQGKYGRYGFVIAITRDGYRVVYNVDGKLPLIHHEGNPFPSMISAGEACEELLKSLLNKQ